MKRIFIPVALLLLNIISAQAASPYAVPTSQEAIAFVKDLVQKGQAVADKPGDHQQEFGELLRDNFVTDEIAKFVLGSKWRSMTAEQRARFQKLYEKRLVKINSDPDKVKTFRDSTPTISETATSQKDGSVLVKGTFASKSKPSDPAAKVDFKIVKKNGELKVLDILFENISKLIAERNEYAAIWSQQGSNPEKFLKYLESTV